MEYDGLSIPSDTLKAQFLELLESDKSALDVLSKVLKLDVVHNTTISEAISNYEECCGELSLDKWKDILQQLGYLDYFNQHVVANQTALIAVATDMDNVNCNGSLDARHTPVGSQPVDNQPQDQFFDKPTSPKGTTGTEEHTCDIVAEAGANVASLPLVVASQTQQAHGAISKEQLTDEQLHKAAGKAPGESCDMLEAAVTGNFSNQLAVSELELNLLATTGETAGNITGETYHSPKGEWPSWSLPPPEENLSKENVKKNNLESNNAVNDSPVEGFPTSPEIEEREEAVTTTPSRPISPQATHSPQNPLVTGRNRSYQSNAVGGAHPPVNHEPDSKNSDHEGSGNPAEHDDTEHRVLPAELQYKEFDEIQELRDQLQRSFEEFRRHLMDETNVLKAESQRLKQMCVLKEQQCKTLEEMYISKRREFDRLVEYIRQHDKQYAINKVQEGTLQKENRELSEQLDTARRQQEELQVQNQKLEEKIEQQRLDFERKMAVMSEERCNSEMEMMNLKLAKESSEEKAAQLESFQAQISCLQHDLEAFKGQLLSAQTTSEEYKRRFEETSAERNKILAESNEMQRMSNQLYLWKEQECERMNAIITDMETLQRENEEEIEDLHRGVSFAGKMYGSEKQKCKKRDALIQQQYERFDNVTREKETLQRENQEMSEKLHAVNELMEKLRLENEQKLQDERERQKLELERRVAEASQAFYYADSNRNNKCPREEEEEGGAEGGGNEHDNYDDDVVFDDDDDDDDDCSQSGVTFGSEDGELSSTKVGGGEGGGEGGGDKNNVDDDDDDDIDNSSQSGGINRGHESRDDSKLSSTCLRKEGGGVEGGGEEGGGGGDGTGVDDNEDDDNDDDDDDDSSQSGGTNGGHEPLDDVT